jgi:hypothetical protein
MINDSRSRQEGGLPTPEAPVVSRMATQIREWEGAADERSVFLNCYLLMTRNILSAIERSEFHDSAWVNSLMERFADYYFVALEAYENEPASAPAVWQVAHNMTRAPNTLALQKLLVGVNAHINFDLVLSLVDMLGPEWDALAADQRSARYDDHCHVNEVIGRTIDAVQDQVLEPAMPWMAILDEVLGSMDEKLVSHLITHWREAVWHNAVQLLETSEPSERARLILQVEREALELANRMV